MALDGPSRKILLALDLDYTHFNTAKREVSWIGSEAFWHETYHSVIEITQKKGIDVVFMVVTNKDIFDDICAVAAASLMPFLSRHHPGMYQRDNRGQHYCYVYVNNSYYYEGLSSNASLKVQAKGFSHFVVQAMKTKSPFILEVATSNGIPAEHCILLDDTPDVLAEAAFNQINTIGFQCFNKDLIPLEILDDAAYVKEQLLKNRAELVDCVNKLCHQIIADNPAASKTSSEQNFLPGFQGKKRLPIFEEIAPSDMQHVAERQHTASTTVQLK